MKNNRLSSLRNFFHNPWIFYFPWFIKKENKFNYLILKKLLTKYNQKGASIKALISFFGYICLLTTNLFSILIQIFLQSYIVTGKEINTGTDLSILFISDSTVDLYVIEKIFLKGYKIKKHNKFLIWNIRKLFRDSQTRLKNIDGIFIKSHFFYYRFFRKNGFTIIPTFISMTLDISKPIDLIKKNFSSNIKTEINKLKRNGFNYCIYSDIEKFNFFYHKMYLPYINHRYREHSLIVNYPSMLMLFYRECSNLMLINNDEKHVLGSIFTIKKNIVRGLFSGIIDGNNHNRKQSAYAALYYFTILNAKQIHAKTLHIGTCRSFLNDGLLQYKRKWGASISCPSEDNRESMQYVYAFKFFNFNKGIKSFLLNNPFIYIGKKNKMYGAFFTEKSGKLKPEETRHLEKIYKLPNINDLIICRPEELSSILK